MSARRTIEALVLTSVACLLGLLVSRPIWDIDIFWHMAAGRWMRTNGAIPDHDIFGLDPERTWISFQWGYQVLMDWLVERGGLPLVRAVHAAAMVAAFALLYREYRRWLGFGAALALWSVTLLLWQDRINVRPHIFNLLGLAIMLPAFLGAWRTAGRWRLAGWALWFGIWANLHAGGCLIMLIALGAIPAGALLRRDGFGRAVLVWACCLVPCLLAPNFVRGNLHALTLVQTTGETIGEWNAPIAFVLLLDNPGLARIFAGLIPYVSLLGLAGLALTGRLRGRDPVELCALVAFTGLSLLYVRFVHFVAPVWLIVLRWWLPTLRARLPEWSRAVSAALICVMALSLIWETSVQRLYGGVTGAIHAARADLDVRRFPVEAADFLELIGFEGTIFAHARYGGYLLWRLHPRVRTLMDGRLNVDRNVADDVAFVHQKHFTRSHSAPNAARIEVIYDRYGTDALVLEAPGSLPERNHCGWIQVLRTSKLEVYLRADKMNTVNLGRAGIPESKSTGCDR